MNDPPSWTPEQILALAPDTQVAKSAGALGRAGKWKALGRAGDVVWGEHQGSGADPYRVAVAPDGPAFKCTCPSRKRPCKHALGLFLVARAELRAFRESPLPPWVAEWLAKIGRSAARPAKAEPAAPDPKAQARRAARREERVAQGVDALERWLEDLARQGLAGLPGRPVAYWEEQAARLVDAQAPGLARHVRELAAIPASGEGWPARLLSRLARLYLLLEAYRRLEAQPAGLQEEIRSQVGWTQDQQALRAGPGCADRWAVVARQVAEEDRLRVQRTWLWGLAGRRPALLFDFAAGDRPFETSLAPGTVVDAELAFWPGSLPLRALIKAQRGTAPLDALPGYADLDAGLAAYSAALTANPWLDRFLLPLEGAVPVRDGEAWAVRDAQGAALPLAVPPKEGWRLLASSGGRPVTLVSEWDGDRLRPLGAWTGHEYVLLGGEP